MAVADRPQEPAGDRCWRGDWLTERRGGCWRGTSCSTTAPPLSLMPPSCLLDIYMLPPVAVLCPEHVNLRPLRTLVITSSHCFIRLPHFCPSPRSFLLPCVHRDMNAAAAPSPLASDLSSVSSSPLVNGFLAALQGWIGAGVSLAFPDAGMCPCSSKLHQAKVVSRDLESKMKGKVQWSGMWLWYWLWWSWISLPRFFTLILTYQHAFQAPPPLLCQSHRLASIFVYRKAKQLVLKPIAFVIWR